MPERRQWRLGSFSSKNKQCSIKIKVDQKAVNRSSRPEVFCKKDVLRNFAKAPVPESLFNKVAGLR